MKNRYSDCWIVLGAVLVGLLVHSCARRGYPEGGAKDEIPPKVVMEMPKSFNTGFDKKSVSVYFDEFVQLKGINEKFIISPPQNKKPKVRLRGKYVQVDFADTLKPDMTYTLDFADAIVDNNEGNPLGFYRYVFSTGNMIDSLELSGTVVDAERNTPLFERYVFLYSNAADSVPLKQIPDYMARTDSSGFFRVTNIRPATYKILVVQDDNRDNKFSPEAEQVGFLDSLVTPVVRMMTRVDTLHNDSLKTDSIVVKEFLAYGPNNLYFRMFKEDLTQLYLVDGDRKEREKLSFIFSVPGRNDFSIRMQDTVVAENWYVQESSVGNDTIHLWMTDSLVYKQDTLKFVLSYLRTDSTGVQQPYLDSVKYIFKDKKKSERESKRKEEKKPEVVFLKVTASVVSDQDLHRGIVFEFDRPLADSALQHIQLLELVDSVYVPVPYEMEVDSLKMRRAMLKTKWTPEHQYMIKIDSAVMFDIYGHHNNKLETKFKVRPEEYYGKLFLSVSGVQGQVVLQLYKSDGEKSTGKAEKELKPLEILDSKVVNKDGLVEFSFLKEGKYRVRAILDANGNGKWDTGLYLKNRQPEEVRYLPSEINIKQNFDIEQEFKIAKDE